MKNLLIVSIHIMKCHSFALLIALRTRHTGGAVMAISVPHVLVFPFVAVPGWKFRGKAGSMLKYGS